MVEIKVSGSLALGIHESCSKDLERLCEDFGLKKDTFKSLRTFSVNFYEGEGLQVQIQKTGEGTYLKVDRDNVSLEFENKIFAYLNNNGKEYERYVRPHVLTLKPGIVVSS